MRTLRGKKHPIDFRNNDHITTLQVHLVRTSSSKLELLHRTYVKSLIDRRLHYLLPSPSAQCCQRVHGRALPHPLALLLPGSPVLPSPEHTLADGVDGATATDLVAGAIGAVSTGNQQGLIRRHMPGLK